VPKTLFERLKSTNGVGRSTMYREREHLESSDQVLHSILQNLQRLLNSRQGQSPACQDYGLLDVTQVLYGLPEAEDAVERSIQKCIETFEPRLTRIRVKRVEDPSRPLSVCFLITARLASDKNQSDIWFETVVASSGRVKVGRG
jgi:type VI secretion system protein